MAAKFIPHPAIGREVGGSFLFENFLVAAVASILVIRIYLELTGFPQIGGGGLHIAHMLWGGLFLLIALIMLFTFLGRWAKLAGAILGGIGFGTFIDELGKFITSDNNYFFQPTFALIYVIFILLFLSFRAIERFRPLSREEYLANALEALQDAVLGARTADKRDHVLLLLRAGGRDNQLVPALEAAVQAPDWLPPTEPHLLTRAGRRVAAGYRRLLAVGWLHRIIIAVFLLHAIGFLLDAILTIVRDPAFGPNNLALSFVDIGHFFSSTLASLFVLIGVVLLPGARVLALLWFKRSVLLTIFLGQFFSFYSEQLLAIVGVIVNILLLIALDSILSAERSRLETSAVERDGRAATGDPAAPATPTLSTHW